MIKRARLLMLILCGIFLFEAETPAAGRGDPVTFSIDIRSEYTDNRDSKERGEDNVDIFLKPRIDGVFDWERTLLDFYYAPSYRYRSRPSDIQNDVELHHDLGANVEHKPRPRVKLRLKENFNVTDDPSIQKGGTTLRRDCSYTMNCVEAGVNYEFTRRSNLDFQMRHMVKDYEKKVVAQKSSDESIDQRVTIWRQVSRTLALLGIASVGGFDYKNVYGLERDFNSVTGIVGLEKIFSSNLRSGVRLGWRNLDYHDSRIGSKSAPFLNLAVQASTTPSTRITAAVSYFLRESFAYPFASQEYTDFYTKLEWDASRKITIGLAGLYWVGDYDTAVAPSTTPEWLYVKDKSGQETAIVVTAEAVYKINLNTSVKLIQRYEEVDSDVSVSFARNAATLVLSREF